MVLEIQSLYAHTRVYTPLPFYVEKKHKQHRFNLKYFENYIFKYNLFFTITFRVAETNDSHLNKLVRKFFIQHDEWSTTIALYLSNKYTHLFKF